MEYWCKSFMDHPSDDHDCENLNVDDSDDDYENIWLNKIKTEIVLKRAQCPFDLEKVQF